MSMNMKLDLAALSEVISSTLSVISDLQGEAESVYCDMASAFSESSGDEADALREQLEAEKYVVGELAETLGKFVSSIRFAADELANMDTTGAQYM